MGRCVGIDCVTFKDGTHYRFEDYFPPAPAKVAISMSGGVESAILLAILIDRYGKDNVLIVSIEFSGRRMWESTHPRYIAGVLNIKTTHMVPATSPAMTPKEYFQIFLNAKESHGFDYWFSGLNRNQFSASAITSPYVVERLKKQGYIVPFVWLKKWQTIELHILLGFEELLSETHSCTQQPPEMQHCGQCYCCHERAYGFLELDRMDSTTYNVPLLHVQKKASNFIKGSSV